MKMTNQNSNKEVVKEQGTEIKDYARISEERKKKCPHSSSINLPSNGLIPDPSYPTSLNYSDLTVRDMKRLVSEPDTTYYKILIDVISELIGMDAMALTVDDFDYTVVSVRVNSVSPICSLIVTCDNCNQVFPFKLDLTKFNIVHMKEDFNEPVRIKTSNGELALKLIRVADNIEVDEKGGDNIILAKCAAAIANGKSFEERLSLVEDTLSVKDVNLIRSFLSIYSSGVDRLNKAFCPTCKEGVDFWLPFRSDILFGMGDDNEEYFRKAIL